MAALENESTDKVEERLQFDMLLTEISTDFVNLPVDRIDAAIVASQRRICEHLGIDRSVLWQVIEGTSGQMRLSHIHDVTDGVLPEAPFNMEETFPWGFGLVANGKVLAMERTGDLPPEAHLDREAFSSWGVKSCVFAPLKSGGKVRGALSFCILSGEKSWPESIVQRLQLVAQIFTNALVRKQAGEHLTALRRFEALLTEISTYFINLPVDRIDDQIEDAQERVCECLGMDLSALWQWSDSSPDILTLTHLHSPPDGPERPEHLNANDAFPWSMQKMNEGKPLIIHTESLPPEAARDQEMRRYFGVKTSVGIPLLVGGGRNIGFISFDTLKEERYWPDSVVKRIELVGQIFANALTRKHADEQLDSLRKFESLVVDISAKFVNLPTDLIDAQIEDTQRCICECLDIELSVLWQWSESSPHFMTVTHLHSPPEGPRKPAHIDCQESFPWALERVLRGEILVYSTENMPPEAARDQESRRHFGIQSSVVIPLSAGGGPLIGILTFDTLKEERSWPEPIVDKLCLIAQIFTNALARKRSDLQLRESQARLQMATECAEVGLWIMEAETDRVWVTPQTRALFQFTEDEALDYTNFNDKIDPADQKRVKQKVQDAIRSGQALDIDFRVVLPDDSVRWIRASGKPMPGAHGQGVRLMGASKDVSERKRMEEQLRGQLAEIESLKQQLEAENIHLRKEIELQHVHEEIVSRSPVMKQILAQVEQVGRTDATVLIEGETGTGKELLARAVHRMSDRQNRPLVTVNCASLPPTLVESELFGREKGAYTGALTRMTGRFEMADGATLFLDEIGELPLDVQAKLLRVLEQGSFERLGSTQSIQVDVRVIAATNHNLEKQVDTGRFRKDLYYRLNVFPLHLPPLRERPEDIPPLVWTFIRQYESKMGRRIDHMPHQCMDELQRYAWPGNVRELRNVIERALIVCNSRTLKVHPPNGTNGVPAPDNLNLAETERRHIVRVLEQTGWRLSGSGGAADLLGLKRTTLQSKMKRLGIQRPPQ